MNRREIITTLLEHLLDFETTLVKSGTGSNAGVTLMPTMWNHPSVRELHATLDRLYLADRTAHAHLVAYYRSEWRTVATRRRTRDRKGRPHTTEGPRQRQRLVSGWILAPCVDRGRNFIINDFQGDPFLPNELLEPIHVSAPSEQIG